jgi:hypothetical protein
MTPRNFESIVQTGEKTPKPEAILSSE